MNEKKVRNFLIVFFSVLIVGLLVGIVLINNSSRQSENNGEVSKTTAKKAKTKRMEDILRPEDADYVNDHSELVTTNADGSLPETAVAFKSQYLVIARKAIHYTVAGVKKGQSVINKKPRTEAATWGGVAKLDVNDNKNTHIIAHNPGAFSVLLKLKKGNKITVVDTKKQKRTYTVRVITKVDDDAYELKTHKDYWTIITGTGGGERITLQTCLSEVTNLIVIAYK